MQDIERIFIEHENVLKKTKETCKSEIFNISKNIAKAIASGSTLFFAEMEAVLLIVSIWQQNL